MKHDLVEILFNAVNEQGYLLSEACADLLSKRKTGWRIAAQEYPVKIGTEDTRIDIVLYNTEYEGSEDLYAIVECKRADPQYVCWLFGVSGPPEAAECLCSGVEHLGGSSDKAPPISSRQVQIKFNLSSYSAKWWLEVKRNVASAKKKSSPDNIEAAFTQVLKGAAGFGREQFDQRRKGHVGSKAIFVPVVITTAPLIAAEYKVENVDLATGRIRKDKIWLGPANEPLQEEEWILVNYGAGENVIPQLIPTEYYSIYPADLRRFKTRSIFVVNSNSIESFFSRLRHD